MRIQDGIAEYEDLSEYAPSGCVSFLTIHQAKGLEFPIVVVGSLWDYPRNDRKKLFTTVEEKYFHRPVFEPADKIKFFDFWRLYLIWSWLKRELKKILQDFSSLDDAIYYTFCKGGKVG